MATWSSIRNKLETEYLAESLRGSIKYYTTTYRKSHDQEGRAAILFNGQEVLQGNYYNLYLKAHLLSKDDLRRRLYDPELIDEYTLELGMFDQRNFYNSFKEFDNQSIECSLSSDNLLVRIFAVLDRRVGKRRLASMMDTIHREPSVLQFFYFVRLDAEGMQMKTIAD